MKHYRNLSQAEREQVRKQLRDLYEGFVQYDEAIEMLGLMESADLFHMWREFSYNWR